MATIEEDYPGFADYLDLIRGEVALEAGDAYSEDAFQNGMRAHIHKWISDQNKAGYSFNEINEAIGLKGTEKGEGLIDTLFGPGYTHQFNKVGEKIANLPTWTGLPQAQAGFSRIKEVGAQSVEKVGQAGGYGAKALSLANAKKQLQNGIDPRTNQPIDLASLSEQDKGEILTAIGVAADRSHRVGSTLGQIIPSPWGPTPGEQFARDIGQEKPSLMGGSAREEAIFDPAESAALNVATVGANIFDLTSIFGGAAKAAYKAEKGFAKTLSNVDVPAAPVSRAQEIRNLPESAPYKAPAFEPQKSGLLADPNANVLDVFGDTPAKVTDSTNPMRGLPETSARPSPIYKPTELGGKPSVKDLHGDMVEKLRIRAEGQINPAAVKQLDETRLAPIRARAQEIKDVIRNSDPKKIAGLVKKLGPEVDKLPPELKAEVLKDFEDLIRSRLGANDLRRISTDLKAPAKVDITESTVPGLKPGIDAEAVKFEDDFRALDKNKLNEDLGLVKRDLGPKLTAETTQSADDLIRSMGGSISERGVDPDLLKMLPDESVQAGKMPGAITDELDPGKTDLAVRGHYQNWLKKNKRKDSKDSLAEFMSDRQRTTKGTDTRAKYAGKVKSAVKKFTSEQEGQFDFGAAEDIVAKVGKAGIEATTNVIKGIRGNSYERAVRAELKGSTRLALSDAKKIFFENSHLPANERAMLAKDKFEADVKFAIGEAKRKIKEIYPTLSDEGVNAAVHDYEIGLPTWNHIADWSKAGRNLWPEKLGKLVQSLTSGTRKGLTVYNPGIHLPNIAGDLTFVADAGGNWKYLATNSRRINDIIMNPNNPLHNIFLKKGIIGSEMAQKPLPLELKHALDGEKDPQKLLMMMHDIEARLGDTWVTGKLLNYPDQFMKTGLALQSTELGIRNGFNPLKRDIFQLDDGTADWDRAARHVLDFTPSYDTIHPFINRTFGSTGAALMNHPFIKFPIENARIKKNVLMSRPVYSVVSRGTHAALLTGMWAATAASYHLSPDFSSGWGAVTDAYNREMKNPNNKGKVLIPKPWRGNKGKIEFWDMTYLFPSGGVTKNIKQHGIVKGLQKEFMGGGLLNRDNFESAETRTDSTALSIGKHIPAVRATRDLYRGDRGVMEVLGIKPNRGGNPVIAGVKAAGRERSRIIQDINAISDPTKYKLTAEERTERRKKLLRELSQSVKGGGK